MNTRALPRCLSPIGGLVGIEAAWVVGYPVSSFVEGFAHVILMLQGA
jgi:hypothetical protein